MLSPLMLHRQTRGMLDGFELMVCDMAGTTVEEGGMVYETLRDVMLADGLEVSVDDMHPWHGAKKEAVLEHFCLQHETPLHEIEGRILRIADAFTDQIKAKYSSKDSGVTHINEKLSAYLRGLRTAGVMVALDTGYPPDIQEMLIRQLGFYNGDDPLVDAHISAYSVREGRPYPYMIHQLMEKLGVSDVRKVCKVGDSVRDIEEGKNAGCGLVVGVLSGADGADDLMAAGADIVANVVTDLPIPTGQRAEKGYRLPDMS